jgi:hypothetical protein
MRVDQRTEESVASIDEQTSTTAVHIEDGCDDRCAETPFLDTTTSESVVNVDITIDSDKHAERTIESTRNISSDARRALRPNEDHVSSSTENMNNVDTIEEQKIRRRTERRVAHNSGSIDGPCSICTDSWLIVRETWKRDMLDAIVQ